MAPMQPVAVCRPFDNLLFYILLFIFGALQKRFIIVIKDFTETVRLKDRLVNKLVLFVNEYSYPVLLNSLLADILRFENRFLSRPPIFIGRQYKTSTFFQTKLPFMSAPGCMPKNLVTQKVLEKTIKQYDSSRFNNCVVCSADYYKQHNLALISL